MKLDAVEIEGDNLLIDGEKPCLVLLNNDLTEGMVGGLEHIKSPHHLKGWQRRRKSEHYECLQSYVNEIAEILDMIRGTSSSWFVSEDKCSRIMPPNASG